MGLPHCLCYNTLDHAEFQDLHGRTVRVSYATERSGPRGGGGGYGGGRGGGFGDDNASY